MCACESFEVHPAYRSFFKGSPRGLGEGLRGMGIDPAACRARSTVITRTLRDPASGRELKVFVKVYGYFRRPWQRLWRVGRVPGERRGLAMFARLGLRHPEPVAWGTRRNILGRLEQECLVSVADEGAVTLEHWWKQGPRLAAREGSRDRKLLRDLARQLRCLHDAGYFHRDLRWRNIMIVPDVRGGYAPVWFDSPRGFRERTRCRHGRNCMRDLATLDRMAGQRCGLRERVAFLRYYLDVPPGDAAIRGSWLRIGRYARRRALYHYRPPRRRSRT